MMSSAWEHRIPEMLFTSEDYPGEAVSAVKALAIASAEGQRIYQITQENVNTVLPVLNISSDVKYEIQDSVAVGKVATVSQNNITVGSWTGVGYIIADAETGAGAYRISGGSNGGHLSGLFGGLSILSYMAIMSLSAIPAIWAALFLVTLIMLAYFATIITIEKMNSENWADALFGFSCGLMGSLLYFTPANFFKKLVMSFVEWMAAVVGASVHVFGICPGLRNY